MAGFKLSSKRVAISKANAQAVAIVGGAAFLSIFCLFASNALISQNRYQSKVVTAREKAHQQLATDLKNADTLTATYNNFVGKDTNILGGSSTGTDTKSGDNGSIILDALPTTYNFPALASSLEKILVGSKLKVTSITGTDDQLAQQSVTTSDSPQPVAMPFSFAISDANYQAVQQLIDTLDKSVRPIQVDSITLSGGSSDMALTINAHTFFQPAKDLTIKQQVVK